MGLTASFLLRSAHTFPGIPQYGTVTVAAWHRVHPLIHGDCGYFAG